MVAEAKTRAELEAEWWQAWRDEDYSWDGLADPAKNLGGDGGLHGERRLQDYWRHDPETGELRDDDTLLALGELEWHDGKLWYIAHLPLHWPDGTPAKAGWDTAKRQLLAALIAARVRAAEASSASLLLWKMVISGRDGRAQLSGCVLCDLPDHLDGGDRRLHLNAVRSWLPAWDATDWHFGPGLSFQDASFSYNASFSSASFSGDASFGGASFLGDARFNSVSFSGNARFGGARFVGDTSFDRVSFNDDAIFGRAKFSGDASFESASFSGDARFDIASFLSDVRFDSATFSGDASFESASFRGDARFDSASFLGDARFDRAGFSRDASFGRVCFSGNASFSRFVSFSRYADFFETSFSRDANFESAMFAGDANFRSASFSADAGFATAKFGGDAIFESTSFGGDARFDSASFSGDAIFDSATFSSDAIFDTAGFFGTAFFDGTGFSGDADFNNASFLRDAGFNSADFARNCTFLAANFTGDARFTGACFGGEASFATASFAGDTRFSNACFIGHASFDLASFSGDGRFNNASFQKSVEFTECQFETVGADAMTLSGVMSFRRTVFEAPALFGRARFAANPAHHSAAFLGARFKDLADFRGCGDRWIAALDEAEIEKRLLIDDPDEAAANRMFAATILPAAIAGGVDDGTGESLLKGLEGGCRTVKVAMARAKDAAMEQRYYRFELIARRHQAGTPRAERWLSSAYGLISDYGLSLSRPLLTLALTTLYFAGLFAVIHSATLDTTLSAGQSFDALAMSASRVFPFGAFDMVSKEWIGCVAPGGMGGIALLVRTIATLESLIALILVFLFGLAVRRRFQIG